MQFTGIRISAHGTHAAVLDLNSAEVAETHELYQNLMARPQYFVDTLHPAGFQ